MSKEMNYFSPIYRYGEEEPVDEIHVLAENPDDAWKVIVKEFEERFERGLRLRDGKPCYDTAYLDFVLYVETDDGVEKVDHEPLKKICELIHTLSHEEWYFVENGEVTGVTYNPESIEGGSLEIESFSLEHLEALIEQCNGEKVTALSDVCETKEYSNTLIDRNRLGGFLPEVNRLLDGRAPVAVWKFTGDFRRAEAENTVDILLGFNRRKVYTHSVAADCLDVYEEILLKHDIRVPSPEDDEREKDDAGLYGSVYSDLLDDFEDEIINELHSDRADARVLSVLFAAAVIGALPKNIDEDIIPFTRVFVWEEQGKAEEICLRILEQARDEVKRGAEIVEDVFNE